MTELFAFADGANLCMRERRGPFWRPRWKDLGTVARGAWLEKLPALVGAVSGRAPGISVWIGSSQCEFLCIQGAKRLYRVEDAQELLRVELAERVGAERAAEMEISVEPVWGRNLRGCAMARSLLEDVRAATSASGLRLAHVRPWICEAVTHHPESRRASGLLAVREPDAVTVVLPGATVARIVSMPADGAQGAREALRLIEASLARNDSVDEWLHLDLRGEADEVVGARGNAWFLDRLQAETLN